mmetsp:Transcript_30185/g.76672  ORF Transcript_30185/g.76672 Transcript_30185/m.76672 type:complete len:340 (-) Transcript_30185:427-1446(-)
MFFSGVRVKPHVHRAPLAPVRLQKVQLHLVRAHDRLRRVQPEGNMVPPATFVEMLHVKNPPPLFPAVVDEPPVRAIQRQGLASLRPPRSEVLRVPPFLHRVDGRRLARHRHRVLALGVTGLLAFGIGRARHLLEQFVQPVHYQPEQIVVSHDVRVVAAVPKPHQVLGWLGVLRPDRVAVIHARHAPRPQCGRAAVWHAPRGAIRAYDLVLLGRVAAVLPPPALIRQAILRKPSGGHRPARFGGVDAILLTAGEPLVLQALGELRLRLSRIQEAPARPDLLNEEEGRAGRQPPHLADDGVVRPREVLDLAHLLVVHREVVHDEVVVATEVPSSHHRAAAG